MWTLIWIQQEPENIQETPTCAARWNTLLHYQPIHLKAIMTLNQFSTEVLQMGETGGKKDSISVTTHTATDHFPPVLSGEFLADFASFFLLSLHVSQTGGWEYSNRTTVSPSKTPTSTRPLTSKCLKKTPRGSNVCQISMSNHALHLLLEICLILSLYLTILNYNHQMHFFK